MHVTCDNIVNFGPRLLKLLHCLDFTARSNNLYCLIGVSGKCMMLATHHYALGLLATLHYHVVHS